MRYKGYINPMTALLKTAQQHGDTNQHVPRYISHPGKFFSTELYIKQLRSQFIVLKVFRHVTPCQLITEFIFFKD